MHIDLAVVSQDPRFGWGARAMLDPFRRAALELGRTPELLYVAHPSLAGREAGPHPEAGETTPFGRIDALNQLVGGSRLARRATASRSVWLVATTGSHGVAALRSGRPFGAWVATSLEDEWQSRRAGLSPSRRAALAVNAPLLRRLERDVLRAATVVTVISTATRDRLADSTGLEADAIRVLSMPVDLDAFAPLADDEWLVELERPTIAFVGRADDPRKNVDLLLAAVPLMPDVRVLLVGAPPVQPLPDRVEATGFVPSVGEIVRRCALLVVPSRQEGFGVVAAEALAAGVPVVATPSGGPEELLERSGGGVTLSGFDPDELAATVNGLLADRERLLALRRSGRAYVVDEHAPATFRERLRELFGEVDG